LQGQGWVKSRAGFTAAGRLEVKSRGQVASGRASRAAAPAPSLSDTGSAATSSSRAKEQGSGSVTVSGAATRHERRALPEARSSENSLCVTNY
jgi:hypothetical protein